MIPEIVAPPPADCVTIDLAITAGDPMDTVAYKVQGEGMHILFQTGLVMSGAFERKGTDNRILIMGKLEFLLESFNTRDDWYVARRLNPWEREGTFEIPHIEVKDSQPALTDN